MEQIGQIKNGMRVLRRTTVCPACDGTRHRAEVKNVYVGVPENRINLIEMQRLPLIELVARDGHRRARTGGCVKIHRLLRAQDQALAHQAIKLRAFCQQLFHPRPIAAAYFMGIALLWQREFKRRNHLFLRG